jgi:hypothetical protein
MITDRKAIQFVRKDVSDLSSGTNMVSRFILVIGSITIQFILSDALVILIYLEGQRNRVWMSPPFLQLYSKKLLFFVLASINFDLAKIIEWSSHHTQPNLNYSKRISALRGISKCSDTDTSKSAGSGQFLLKKSGITHAFA